MHLPEVELHLIGHLANAIITGENPGPGGIAYNHSRSLYEQNPGPVSSKSELFLLPYWHSLPTYSSSPPMLRYSSFMVCADAEFFAYKVYHLITHSWNKVPSNI